MASLAEVYGSDFMKPKKEKRQKNVFMMIETGVWTPILH